jgi:hypothetical protein
MTLRDTSWMKGLLADLSGSSAESYTSAGQLRKVRVNAKPNAGLREWGQT